MKLLKSILYSAALAATLPAFVSCDSGPIDASDGALDFDLKRFDIEAMEADPTAIAPMPAILKEGDVFEFVSTGVYRYDEDIEDLPYETEATANNARQIEIARRPSGTIPFFSPRLASWLVEQNTPEIGDLKTVESIDQQQLDAILRNVLSNQGGSLSVQNLREALRTDNLISTGANTFQFTDEQGEDIEDGFQALGIEALANNEETNFPVIAAVVKRRIEFTISNSNQDVLDNERVVGTYRLFEVLQFFSFKYTEGEAFLTVILEDSQTEHQADQGSFTLTLNGLQAS